MNVFDRNIHFCKKNNSRTFHSLIFRFIYLPFESKAFIQEEILKMSILTLLKDIYLMLSGVRLAIYFNFYQMEDRNNRNYVTILL